jgi:hypothetical protein
VREGEHDRGNSSRRTRPGGARRRPPWALVPLLVAVVSLTTAGQSTRAASPEPSPGSPAAAGTPTPTAGTPTTTPPDPTTTAPAPAPAPAPVVGSEWTPLIDQGFDTPAALGDFADRYPGWADYDGWHDTEGPGLYDSSRVVTVTDGVLTENLHSEDGEALVVSITPVPHVQTYGRYEVRFRADVVPGYHFSWLLWPADNDWTDGEIDFPETGLDAGDWIMGFSHQIGPTPKVNQWAQRFDGSPQDWHTAVIEWRPDSLTFILDGHSETSTDPLAIPSVPMYWSMQSEAEDPAASTSGGVHIDYVKAWSYTPEAAAG